MLEQVRCKVGRVRELLFSCVALSAALGLGFSPIQAGAQAASTAPAEAQTLAGDWQGTLHAGRDLRTVVKISKADAGGYKAEFYSIDQGGNPMPVTKTTLDGANVKMSLTLIGGTYEGKLSPDGKTITGTWSQGPNPLPLVLTRATPETEWTIPPPTPRAPAMAANADPSFEVATIKPTKPDEKGKAFAVNGRRLHVVNMSLNELISLSYDVQSKQVIGMPPWADTDKFDIDAQPDGEGAPSLKQWKSMVQKLLADRYKLSFHRDKREMPVYALSVAKSGEKMTKSQGDPNGLPGFFFRGRPGDLTVVNATMGEFATFLQSAVLDRPALDQTGLSGRYDFPLNWTPDDSQFGGAKLPPPPADNSNPPPNLYTAMQEQDGLKLDATRAPAEVLVVDHVEKPSAN